MGTGASKKSKEQKSECQPAQNSKESPRRSSNENDNRVISLTPSNRSEVPKYDHKRIKKPKSDKDQHTPLFIVKQRFDEATAKCAPRDASEQSDKVGDGPTSKSDKNLESDIVRDYSPVADNTDKLSHGSVSYETPIERLKFNKEEQEPFHKKPKVVQAWGTRLENGTAKPNPLKIFGNDQRSLNKKSENSANEQNLEITDYCLENHSSECIENLAPFDLPESTRLPNDSWYTQYVRDNLEPNQKVRQNVSNSCNDDIRECYELERNTSPQKKHQMDAYVSDNHSLTSEESSETIPVQYSGAKPKSIKSSVLKPVSLTGHQKKRDQAHIIKQLRKEGVVSSSELVGPWRSRHSQPHGATCSSDSDDLELAQESQEKVPRTNLRVSTLLDDSSKMTAKQVKIEDDINVGSLIDFMDRELNRVDYQKVNTKGKSTTLKSTDGSQTIGNDSRQVAVVTPTRRRSKYQNKDLDDLKNAKTRISKTEQLMLDLDIII